MMGLKVVYKSKNIEGIKSANILKLQSYNSQLT